MQGIVEKGFQKNKKQCWPMCELLHTCLPALRKAARCLVTMKSIVLDA